MWHDRSGLQPMSCFNDPIPSPGSLQGGCWGWTPLAGGPFVEGGMEALASRPCNSLLNIYHCHSQPKVGVGGRIKMLRRWFFKDTSKALPSTAVSKWRWDRLVERGTEEVERGLSGAGGGTLGGSGPRGEPDPLDSSVTRLSGPWEQTKSPSNLPQNPDYDSGPLSEY